MSTTIGRPPLGRDKKTYIVKVRFNEEDYDTIDILAHKCGLSKSEFLRQAGLKSVIKAMLTDEEKHLLHELKKLGANLNQLAHHANIKGLAGIVTQVKTVLSGIGSIVSTLKKRMKT